MSTLAFQDTLSGASSGSLAGRTSTSGSTWANSASSNQADAMAVDAIPSITQTSSGADGCMGVVSNWTPPGANVGFGMKVQLYAGTIQMGPGARIADPSGQGVQGYFFQAAPASNQWQLYKATTSGASFNQIGTPVSHTFGTEVHYMYLLVNGSTITGYVDGTSVMSATDSTVTAAGLVGIRGYCPNSTTTSGAHVLSAQTDPQAATLSGTLTGAVGVASGTLTLTLEVPATLATATTLSDGGAGGTFSPTSLSFAAASGATAGGQAATFTYTPATNGNIPLTLTTTTPVGTFITTGTYASSAAPALSVSPTSATVAFGGTQSITPTLANSSAALHAAAAHGSVSTSTPTSGTAFTYTAPSSGYTSDTVTVTDATDSLTAATSIAISIAPSLSVSPTSATVPAGGTQSITPTLLNSSAALHASATYGSVSTSTPTSGTAFTYTAPSTGHTSDTVTVTDTTDSLTAATSITVTPTATTYTFSGANSTAVNTTSANITLTPNGTVPSDTVTPSDNSAGGTFTPTSSTWSNSSSGHAFTYTPATGFAGTVTMTFSDTAGLTPSTYTFSVVRGVPYFCQVSGLPAGYASTAVAAAYVTTGGQPASASGCTFGAITEDSGTPGTYRVVASYPASSVPNGTLPYVTFTANSVTGADPSPIPMNAANVGANFAS